MAGDKSLLEERYLLHLFARALKGEVPQEIPESVSWRRVFDLSCQNGVQGLVWEAARHLRSVPSDVRDVWEQSSTAILVRNIQLEAERCEIVSRLAEAGVSYLVLKGATLLPLYASPSMRTMSDNDILFGFVEPSSNDGFKVAGSTESERSRSLDAAGKIVRSVMSDLGYTVREHSGDVCDIQFQKPPYYFYEMHFSLVETYRPYYFYYENPWKRAIPVGMNTTGRGREFKFSYEDLCVYLIVHAYKHEHMSGEGIRILADIAVVLQAAGERFNRVYLENELSRLELKDYGCTLLELSCAIVNEEALDARLEGIAMEMIDCGFGSVERFVSSKIEEERSSGRWGRLGYLRKLCSPDYYCPGELEFLAKNRLLRPLFPVGRFVLFLRNALRTPRAQLSKVITLLRGK